LLHVLAFVCITSFGNSETLVRGVSLPQNADMNVIIIPLC
jgi:hypothetical protein